MTVDQEIGPMTPELLAGLEARGFEAEAFLGLNLGVGESLRARGSLAIPFFNGDVLAGVKVRKAEKGFGLVGRTSSPPIFYNRNCLRDPSLADEPLVVAEGEPGCWAALLAGFRRSVAVPFAAVDGRRLPYVEESADLWRDAREVVICTYDDDNGHKLRDDIAQAFGRMRCKWVRYPEKCFDLASTLRATGKEGVQSAIAQAQWMAVPNIYAMSDLPDPPANPAYETGIIGLADHLKLRRGDLTIVSGVPGTGKTTLVNEMTCRLARSVRLKTLFASFEQRPKPDHRRSLRTFHAEKLEVHMSDEEKAAADAWIDQYFRFLLPTDDEESSLDWLLETMAAAVTRFDPFVCVIDPWNEIEHIRPPGMTSTEYTGYAIRALKRFARKHRVHIIVIAHPAKLQRDRNGEYPKPTLYDIADSAHWANKADLGVMIWRKTGDQEAEIAVVKSRYYNEIGRPGSVKGIWNESTGRYTITNDGAHG